MKLLQEKAMPIVPHCDIQKQPEQMKNNPTFATNMHSLTYEYEMIMNARMKSSIDRASLSEPGHFQNTISPMLAAGQEAQLIYWLRAIGLLPPVQKCKNACNNAMQLVPANNMDVYQWRCATCMEKRKVREDTVFRNIKCKFGDTIRLLYSWSEGNTAENMSVILPIKKAIAKTVYNLASNSARDYLRSNISQFRLGGPGVIVLVDTFPDINSNIRAEDYCTRSRLILCFAEVKAEPTRFYFHCLERYSKTAKQLIEDINTHALKIVQNIVLPGSVIVGNAHTTICSYDTLTRLKHVYPVTVSTDDLRRHDNPLQSLHANLGVIWRPALRLCAEAQYCRHAEVTSFLARYLFCRRFGTKAFEMLLNQLAY